MVNKQKYYKFSVCCDNCSKSLIDSNLNFEFSSMEQLTEVFQKSGWQESNGEHYCPKCAREYLKLNDYYVINAKIITKKFPTNERL